MRFSSVSLLLAALAPSVVFVPSAHAGCCIFRTPRLGEFACVNASLTVCRRNPNIAAFDPFFFCANPGRAPYRCLPMPRPETLGGGPRFAPLLRSEPDIPRRPQGPFTPSINPNVLRR